MISDLDEIRSQHEDKIAFGHNGWWIPNGICPINSDHTPLYALCGMCGVRSMSKLDHKIFSLREPQTQFAKMFWTAWEVFWGVGSFHLHATPSFRPHQIEVRDDIQLLILDGIPDEIKASPGHQGLLSQSRWHQEQHQCPNGNHEERCAKCGHFCKHHEVNGPCFTSYAIREWVDLPPSLVCGCPYFGKGVRDRWCACDGFVSSTLKEE